MTELKAKIEHQLDELMKGAENYFGAINPKRAGHIHCALEGIMGLLNAGSGSSSPGSPGSLRAVLNLVLQRCNDNGGEIDRELVSEIKSTLGQSAKGE